jgi:phenylalanyl-tRNA synthetase beta chain
LLVKKQVTHAEISKALIKADSLIKQVEIFDVYEGKNIGEDYKSMAYRLTYSDPNRTLTSKEVDATQTKVEELLKRKFKAEVR